MASERIPPTRRARRALLALLCVSLFSTRVDAAHLHICLDGQEPVASLRTAEDPKGHPEAQAPHNDRDIALASDAISKQDKGKSKQPLASPPVAEVVAATQNFYTELLLVVLGTPTRRLVHLPEARGPPLFHIA